MTDKNQVTASISAIPLLEDLPEHWSPWVAQTMSELYAAEEVLFPYIPESAPNWVHDLLFEVVKVMQPTTKLNFVDEPGEALLGSVAGHFRHILEAENGLPKQLENLGSISEKLDAEMRKNWGKRKYERYMHRNRRFIADVERFFELQEICYEKKYEALERCFSGAIKLPLKEQADFFGAYAKALTTELFDADGQSLHQTTSTPLYVWMVIFWRYVRRMPSATAVHQWLCRLFGPQQVGELGRIKQLCFRHKIRLRHQGRPKKKK
jgi:hypothetical protein